VWNDFDDELVFNPSEVFMRDLWQLRDRADELQVMIHAANGDIREAYEKNAWPARALAASNRDMYQRELSKAKKTLKVMVERLMVWRDEWRGSGCAGTAPWLRDGKKYLGSR
jgi:hypothetical protein